MHTLVAWLEHGDIDEAEFLTLMKLRGKSEGRTPRVVDADQCERNMDVAALRALPYQEYLKTDHWQKMRKAALERADHRCQACYAKDVQLDVHHRTYERLGEELPEDLFVLCHVCHEAITKYGGQVEKKVMEDLQPRRGKTFPDEEEAELSEDIVPILPDKGRKAEDIDLNAAIAVYNTGATSRYQLAKIFGLPENQGRKLKELIEARAKQGDG